MKLFEVLPQNLFSILVSKNRNLYTDALFVLRKAFKQEMTINRSDLIAMLVANLDEAMLEMDMEAEKEEFDSQEEGTKAGQGLSATAYYILRRLRDTGWVEVEYQVDSFEENITLPDYTVKLINLLYSFTDETVREYNSYVYSTYSALRTADSERDDFMYNALLTAYDNTIKLVDELKTLHNNIRRYHQTLNSYATANDVLKGHFDEYKTQIMDRIYHPLKTLDSVPRFKIPITKILADWLADYELRRRIADQAVLRGKYPSQEEAMDDIILKMGEISDIYDGMDGMLEEIDRKNNAYTRASIEKMHYLLNTDRSIKGKLVEILTSNTAGSERLQEMLAASVNLFTQRFLDEKSIYVKANRSLRKEGKPLGLPENEPEFGREAVSGFMEKARKLYSHQKVIAFVDRLMTGKLIVNSSDIALQNDEEFILLILAALKNDEKNPLYKVEFLEGYLESGGYRIPNMRFIRKGTEKHVG